MEKGLWKRKSFVQFEVDQIRAIMEFEVRANKKNKSWKSRQKEYIASPTTFFY